jgi:hypothetical protein
MAEAWIATAAAAAPPALQAPLQELGDLASRKLYKQLTDKLIELLKDPANAQRLSYKDLYEVRGAWDVVVVVGGDGLGVSESINLSPH